MNVSKTNRFLSWILICAFSLMQVSPAWANTNANPFDGLTDEQIEKLLDFLFGDPVNTKSGAVYFLEEDWEFNTPGVPIVLRRTYNSDEAYDSPVGSGWSHSMDWRLHQAREIVTKIIPPVTNQNFKVNLWEGTQLLCDGQVYTNGIAQTNLLTIIPKFRCGAPVYEQVGAYVSQPGGNYSVDLNQPDTYGAIANISPLPVASLEDMDGNPLPEDGVAYETNQWLEVYTGNGRSTRFWDNNTNGTYLAQNSNWRITSTNNLWTLRLSGGEERIFNTDGRMVRHQNGWGPGISFSYTDGELTTAEHDNGLTLQFAYADGHITGVSAGSGANLTYGYTNGLLDTVTQNYGSKQRVRHFEYTDGVMTKRINPEGHEYNYGYETDANGKLTSKSNSGSVQPGNYFSQSLVYRSETLTDAVSYTRGLEQWNRFAFSSKTGELTEHFGPGVNTVDAETRGISYSYNSAGDKIETATFDNNAGEFFSSFTDYDGRHNPTNRSVAYNTTNRTLVSSMVWNHDFMRPSSIQNADGEKTMMTYANGSLQTLKQFYTESNSYDTAYGYTTSGQLATLTNANQHTTAYTYDSDGYLDIATPSTGPKVDMDFGSSGNIARVEVLPEGGGAGTGRVTEFNYNPLGWLESRVDADGRGETNSYNKLGDLTNTVDRAGHVTDYTYTPESRLASMTQYLEVGGSNVPVRLAYDYDQQLNALRITEPRGRYVESYQLDIQDRVTSVTNIEGQAMSIDYGVADFINSITRFDGSTISNTYDTAGRQSETAYIPFGGSAASLTVSRDYYPDFQLKTISDETTSVSNTYNRLNRLTVQNAQVGNLQSSIANAYDPVGNVTNSVVTFGGSSSTSTAYEYDEAERLTSIASGLSTLDLQTFDYAYSPINGRISSVTNSESGVVTSYAYDIMDRATNITYTASDDSLIRSLDYQYDALGMITNKVLSGGSSSTSIDYEYDTINRLVGETRTGGTTSSSSYSYDLAGNRTSVIAVAGGGDPGTNTYTLGTGNRLASWGANGSALYDSAGNTTNLVSNDGAELNLQWDERYRLTSVEGGDGSPQPSVSYTYDVLGRKISRTAGILPAEVEHYIYSGNQIAADLDENGDIIRSYTWGPGIDNLLSMTVYTHSGGSTASSTYYTVKDHQNSVLAFTDASGTLVESYAYDAWGNVTVYDSSNSELETSQLGNRYLFQGREYDSSTGLYYFRARWYNPETGRWLSKDPIGISGGLNLYVFCGNSPVNFTDPLGLQSFNNPTGAGTGSVGSGFNPHASTPGGTTNIIFTNGPSWSQEDVPPFFNPDFNGTPVDVSETASTAELFLHGALCLISVLKGAITLTKGGVNLTLKVTGLKTGTEAAKALEQAIKAGKISQKIADKYAKKL